jgi:hypothetical protein
MKFPKYQMNLRMFDNKIFSYETLVAWQDDVYLRVLKGYEPGGFKASQTTSKHINYVAQFLGCSTTYEGAWVDCYRSTYK